MCVGLRIITKPSRKDRKEKTESVDKNKQSTVSFFHASIKSCIGYKFEFFATGGIIGDDNNNYTNIVLWIS